MRIVIADQSSMFHFPASVRVTRTSPISLFLLPVALFAVLVFSNARGAALEDRTIQAARCSGPVVIDGKLDEETWKKAPHWKDFTVYSSKEKATPQSEMMVLYDDEALYIGLIAYEPNMAGLKAKHTGHPKDLKAYEDDCFEVMVSPSGKSRTLFSVYFQPQRRLRRAQDDSRWWDGGDGGERNSGRWNQTCRPVDCGSAHPVL